MPSFESCFLAFDIGGTKLLIVLADASGRILDHRLDPTPPALQAGIDLLLRRGRELLAGRRPLGLGAAIGGPVDRPAGTASPLHQPEWKQVPLRRILEEAFDAPLLFDVDTNVAALGEWHHAADRPESLYYITLSTGIGAAFVRNGEIYRGAAGIHPEFGHQAVPLHPRLAGRTISCGCGAAGCLEALASGSGIRRIYGHPPEALTEDEGDEVVFHLRHGIRNVAHLLAPAVIVLGGGIAVGWGQTLIDRLKAGFEQDLRIVPAPHLCLSGLRERTAVCGAIVLARRAAHERETRSARVEASEP